MAHPPASPIAGSLRNASPQSFDVSPLLMAQATQLFTFAPANSGGAQVYLATLRNGKVVNPQLLLTNDTSSAFTPAGGGRVLFVRNDNLFSQKLDLKARKLSGDPELVQEHVASYAGLRLAYFSVSHTGAIAWRSGSAVVSQVAIFDRKGNRAGTAGAPGPVTYVALSPDGSRLIASGDTGAWLVDASGPGQVTLNPEVGRASIWSSDGSRLIFLTRDLKIREWRVGGSSEIRELGEIPATERMMPNLGGISPDGRRMLYGDFASGLFSLALGDGAAPQRVVGQRADNFALSPDGMWVAYVPRSERAVYVQPISGDKLPRRIGTGSYAVWRGDGKEILYRDRDRGGIMSVKVDGSGQNLSFGAAELLFPVAEPMGLVSPSRPLAVNHDGSRIYFLQSREQPDSGVIHVRTGAIR